MRLETIRPNMTVLHVNNDDVRILFSYKTPVAVWKAGKGFLKTATRYSNTTTKHINRWVTADAQTVPQSSIDTIVTAYGL